MFGIFRVLGEAATSRTELDETQGSQELDICAKRAKRAVRLHRHGEREGVVRISDVPPIGQGHVVGSSVSFLLPSGPSDEKQARLQLSVSQAAPEPLRPEPQLRAGEGPGCKAQLSPRWDGRCHRCAGPPRHPELPFRGCLQGSRAPGLLTGAPTIWPQAAVLVLAASPSSIGRWGRQSGATRPQRITAWLRINNDRRLGFWPGGQAFCRLR
jgi:hypothetical protein